MSYGSSREKYRSLSRGNSSLSLDSQRDATHMDRPPNGSNSSGSSLLSLTSARSDSHLLSTGKRNSYLQSSRSTKPWMNTCESNDVGVVPEDVSEDTSYPAANGISLSFENQRNSQSQSQVMNPEQQVWYEIRDYNSNKLFYFDAISHVSQWNRPVGVTVIPANQRGVAIILGNGVIEKDYLAASRMRYREYFNEEDHIYDPIEFMKRQIFTEEESHGELTSMTDQTSPTQDSNDKEDSQLAYERFVETYFNFYRRGIFHTKTTKERVMSYKPSPIHIPLLKASSGYKQESVELNKQILRYVTAGSNVNTTGRSLAKSFHNIREIVRIVMNNYQGLRNEVYCQLLKVMNGSSELVILAAWDMLMVLCATIAPTEVLMPYIIQECHKARNNKIVHTVYLRAEKLLKKTMIMKARSVVPTNAEINSILNDDYVAIRVYLYNNNYITIQVKAGMTVGDVESQVARKLNLGDNGRLFSLYECCSDGFEWKCDPEEQVLVIISKWQNDFSMNHSSNDGHGKYHFLYHCTQFIDFDRNEKCMLEIMFIQGCHDMKALLYPCTDVDMITLLALYLKSLHGDDIITDEEYLQAYNEFIPMSSRNQQLFEKLKKFCHKLHGRERKWYLCAYVDYLMKWELYGIVCFHVETIGRTDMRPNSILAIGMHGVFILQSETKLIQREIPFDAIPCWGYTKDSIILYVGSFVHQEKLVFGTKEGKEINNLLQHYVTYLTEQLEANGTHS